MPISEGPFIIERTGGPRGVWEVWSEKDPRLVAQFVNKDDARAFAELPRLIAACRNFLDAWSDDPDAEFTEDVASETIGAIRDALYDVQAGATVADL